MFKQFVLYKKNREMQIVGDRLGALGKQYSAELRKEKHDEEKIKEIRRQTKLEMARIQKIQSEIIIIENGD